MKRLLSLWKKANFFFLEKLFIGFAPCCADVAAPFRQEFSLFSAMPLLGKGGIAQSLGRALAEGQSHIRTTGGKAEIRRSIWWKLSLVLLLCIELSFAASELRVTAETSAQQTRAGNPIIPGWYADPEAHVFQNEYWIYPTYSDRFEYVPICFTACRGQKAEAYQTQII